MQKIIVVIYWCQCKVDPTVLRFVCVLSLLAAFLIDSGR